jgi:hypothetical protein
VHTLSNIIPNKANLMFVISDGCNFSTTSLRIHIPREYLCLQLLLNNVLHSNLKCYSGSYAVIVCVLDSGFIYFLSQAKTLSIIFI